MSKGKELIKDSWKAVNAVGEGVGKATKATGKTAEWTGSKILVPLLSISFIGICFFIGFSILTIGLISVIALICRHALNIYLRTHYVAIVDWSGQQQQINEYKKVIPQVDFEAHTLITLNANNNQIKWDLTDIY